MTAALFAWCIASPARAANSDLRIEGAVGYERTGSTVVLTAERICNRSAARSGTVHIGLWATIDPDPKGSGYSVAETSLSSGPEDFATLEPNGCFTGIRFTTTWASPGQDGSYYLHFYVAEYPDIFPGPGSFISLDHVTFDKLLIVGNPSPPPPPPPSSDDHGNNLASATTATVNTPVGGNIETTGDMDVFMFTLTTAGTVSVSTEGTTDTVGELLNSAGATIDFSEDASKTDLNFSIPSTELEAGMYYVRVSGAAKVETGAYTLKISATPRQSTTPPSSSSNPPPATKPPSSGGGGGGGGGATDVSWALALAAFAMLTRRSRNNKKSV
jgi:hypothetical protein